MKRVRKLLTKHEFHKAMVAHFQKYSNRFYDIERFSFECRKTKTKTKSMIGFGLASDWLSRWREFFKPITERSKSKSNSDYFRYSIENRSIAKTKHTNASSMKPNRARANFKLKKHSDQQ